MWQLSKWLSELRLQPIMRLPRWKEMGLTLLAAALVLLLTRIVVWVVERLI
jgi:hypothetical protein